jgi:hypothetical protein
MKKVILALGLVSFFFACKKSDLPATEASTNEAIRLAVAPPPPEVILCYVTYDATASKNSLIKFNSNTGVVTAILPITFNSPLTTRVMGGITRIFNPNTQQGQGNRYFINAYNGNAAGAVYQVELNISTGNAIGSPVLITNTYDAAFNNFLRENAPSLNYHYRKGGQIVKGQVGTGITQIVFRGPGLSFGSMSFGAGNAGVVYTNPSDQGTVIGGLTAFIEKNNNINLTPASWAPHLTISSAGYPFAYNSFLLQNCLVAGDNGTLYTLYNSTNFNSGKRSAFGAGPLATGSLPCLYSKDFPISNTNSSPATVTDIEIEYSSAAAEL